MIETIPTPENKERVVINRVNEIIESLYHGDKGIYDPEAKTGQFDASSWLDSFPMMACMITVLEIDSNEKIDTTSFNRLIDSQPFKDKEIVEFGFGSVNSTSCAVTVFLPKLGARMSGVEPNAQNIPGVEYFLPDEDKGNLKAGVGEDIPTLFPGKQFDMVISNRVVEEWPMSGDGSLEEGIILAEDILRKTRESLKEQGFSIHVTTAPFIISQKVLEGMGYEVVVWNGNFGPGLGQGMYNFTILRKQSK